MTRPQPRRVPAGFPRFTVAGSPAGADLSSGRPPTPPARPTRPRGPSSLPPRSRPIDVSPEVPTMRPTRSRRRLRLEALEDRLAPAVFTVTNTDDDGGGSLRQ